MKNRKQVPGLVVKNALQIHAKNTISVPTSATPSEDSMDNNGLT